VTLVDANLILYAYDSSSSQHEPARKWLESTLSEPEPSAFAWMTIFAFLRIGTNPHALRQPFSMADGLEIVSEWLSRPNVVIVNPTERHWEIFRDLVVKGQAQSSLISDAHLAALAIEHGAILATTDRDFTRFPGLRILNPLGA
jgi:uncharacterized protein